MSKRKVVLLGLVCIAMASFITLRVYADVPTINSLSLDEDTNMLTIEVRHANPGSSHYIYEIDVEVNGEVETIQIDEAQSETVFTESYEVTETIETLRARANCNVHGYSQWVELEIQEPDDDNGGGIPGFPVAGIMAGLIVVMMLGYRRYE